MSTASRPPTPTLEPTAAGLPPVRTTALGRRALAVGALAAPVLFLAGNLVFPALPPGITEALPQMARHQEALLAGRLLTGVGALLFLCTVGPLASLVPVGAPAARLLRTGLVAMGVGTVANGISQLVQGYAAEAVFDSVREAGLPLASGAPVIDRVADGLPGLPLGYWTVLLFAAGWVLVAAALLRSGTVGRPLAGALLASVLLGLALATPGWASLVLLPFVALLLVVLVVAIRRGHLASSGRTGHQGRTGRTLPADAR